MSFSAAPVPVFAEGWRHSLSQSICTEVHALVGNTQTQSLSGDITSGATAKEKWPKSGIFSALCGMWWPHIFHI